MGHQAAQTICLWTSSHVVFAARVPLNRMVGNVVNCGHRGEVCAVRLYAVNMISETEPFAEGRVKFLRVALVRLFCGARR